MRTAFAPPTNAVGHDGTAVRQVLPGGTGMMICGLAKKNGAGDGIRTHDFNLGKVALYP